MMVCRRRWLLGAVIVMVAAGVGTTAQAAVGGHTAADLEAAKGGDAIRIREDVLKATPTTPIGRDAFGSDVKKEFADSIKSSNPDARLNSAIIFAQIATGSVDSVLMDMLGSKDPAVRYWGAKGLGTASLVDFEIKANGAPKVVASLQAAAKSEISGVALQEMIRSLAAYGSTAGILTGLDAVAALIQANIPEVGMIDAANVGLKALVGKVKASPAPGKIAAATTASKLARFTAQQYQRSAVIYKDAGSELPKPLTDSVNALVDASLAVMSEAAGAPFSLPGRGSPDELLLNLNAITGTDSSDGELQKALKGVPRPGSIKADAAPSTSTRARGGS